MEVLDHFSRGSLYTTCRPSQHPRFNPLWKPLCHRRRPQHPHFNPLWKPPNRPRGPPCWLSNGLYVETAPVTERRRFFHLEEKSTNCYLTTNNMHKGFNTCNWLTVSSMEHRGKSCLFHLVKLRRGTRSQPCRGCGIGVTNKLGLCYLCGYRRERRRANKAIQREFARLAAIEI